MLMLDRITKLADIWSAESQRSLSRLATIVVNDGKLFERIAAGSTTTVATLEKLLGYLSDEANWPGAIPDEAARLISTFQSPDAVAA